MDQIEEIKSKVDIVEIISEYVPLKKAGRNWKANCPFHGEKTPSFMVNPELQIFKCFGCGVGGDVYSFMEKMEGMTFGEVLKLLADRVGIRLTSYKPSRQEEEKEKLIKVNTLAAEAYQFLLNKHKIGETAKEYVLKRGVTEESVKKFGLGYAPDEWNFLNDFLVKKKGFNTEDLVKSGLLVEGKNYDRFRNRIMFPLNNARGEVVGFAGRVMPGADEKAGGKYVNTPETDIYHKSELLYGFDWARGEIKKAGFAVVVEGELDAICSYQAGIKNTVAIKGSALTQKQVELLRRVTDRIVMGLDADLAGNMAARRGIEIAEKMEMYVETIDWSQLSGEIKDAADIASEDPEKWQELVANTISIYSFLIDSAIKKFGLSVEGKTRTIKDVLPVINLISDEVRKDEYLKELAKKTGVEIEAIRKQMSKLAVNGNQSPVTQKTDDEKVEKSQGEGLEEYIVGLAVRNAQTDLLMGIKDFFRSDYWIKVVKEFGKGKTIKTLANELKGRVEDLMLLEDEKDLNFDKEWGKAVARLEKLRVEEQIPNTAGVELRELAKRRSELTKGL